MRWCRIGCWITRINLRRARQWTALVANSGVPSGISFGHIPGSIEDLGKQMKNTYIVMWKTQLLLLIGLELLCCSSASPELCELVVSVEHNTVGFWQYSSCKNFGRLARVLTTWGNKYLSQSWFFLPSCFKYQNHLLCLYKICTAWWKCCFSSSWQPKRGSPASTQNGILKDNYYCNKDIKKALDMMLHLENCRLSLFCLPCSM